MKLRTSSFNFSVFCKDITRFSPVWVLYSVFLLLALIVMSNNYDVYMTRNVVDFGFWMIVANLIYALVCAQVLFGDLFNSRMCNALHALPLRRESWFGIHVLSGLCFSLIPNFVLTLLLFFTCAGVEWLWLAQSTLQFVFFFGTAVLCVQLAGSRFAMAVVYGLIHFGAMLVYWLLETLYVPLLPGVVMDAEAFRYFCPTVEFFLQPAMEVDYGINEHFPILIGDGWIYLAITAAVGAACGVLALLLYRKRHLETAGDFVAVKWLKPVFLISYTFAMAAFFQMTYELFIGDQGWVFMLLGIAVGYFTAQMFLTRSVKVFYKKSLIGFAAFTLAVVVSLGLTVLDPVGLTRWVPDSEDVQSVALEQNYRNAELTDPELLENIEKFHRAVVGNYRGPENVGDERIRLTYNLKNGRTVQREYWIDNHSEEGEILCPVLSCPELVLGEFLHWEDMGAAFYITYYKDEECLLYRSLIPELMECIIKDCQEGNLPQYWWDWNDVDTVMELTLSHDFGLYSYQFCHLTITDRAVHTANWLRQQEFYQSWQEYHNT